MLQRVQTLYFFGALALIVICFFVPLAVVSVLGGASVPFTLLGAKFASMVSFNAILSFLSFATAFLLLINIFRYKNRKSQMSWVIMIIILLLIIEGLVFYLAMQMRNDFGHAAVSFKIPLIFPVISAILSYLGYRGIKKDEELVRSYDRIR